MGPGRAAGEKRSIVARARRLGSGRVRMSGDSAPSNDSPRGFIRRFPSGGLWSCDPGEAQPPPWGLTDTQLALIRTGDRIALADGSTVEWRP